LWIPPERWHQRVHPELRELLLTVSLSDYGRDVLVEDVAAP
jgi:hypothetical protein